MFWWKDKELQAKHFLQKKKVKKKKNYSSSTEPRRCYRNEMLTIINFLSSNLQPWRTAELTQPIPITLSSFEDSVSFSSTYFSTAVLRSWEKEFSLQKRVGEATTVVKSVRNRSLCFRCWGWELGILFSTLKGVLYSRGLEKTQLVMDNGKQRNTECWRDKKDLQEVGESNGIH